MNYFNTKRPIFIVPSNRCYEEFEKIDKFISILNKSNIGILIENVQKKNGRNGYNPYNLVATIIYCFSQFKSSLREIEKLCVFDLRIIYLMQQEQPSHNVIKECINKYILPYQYEFFSMITKAIIEEFHLDISNQYLDGTKIEANANKYKFVWKPTTFHKRLDSKIKELLLEMGFEITERNFIKSCKLNEYQKNKLNLDINKVGLDSGYDTYEIKKYFEDNNIFGVIQYRSYGQGKTEIRKWQFTYLKEEDVYVCPKTGIVLPYRNIDKTGYKKYYDRKQCEGCPHQKECCGKSKFRTIRRLVCEDINERARKRRLSPEGKNLFKKRKTTVERSFGDSKQNHGYRYTLFKGVEKN